MLNYIWAGLLFFSFAFASVRDISDLTSDTYRNGIPIAVEFKQTDSTPRSDRRLPVAVTLSGATLSAHYGVADMPSITTTGMLVQTADGAELRFAEDISLPEPLATIRRITSSRDNDLRGPVSIAWSPDSTVHTATLVFATVRFVKMQDIAQAAIDFADTAITLALGLVGVLALWMGILAIAEAAGTLHALVRFTQPLIRRLFPDIPKDHPAMGLIVLNLTANVLGLGNAATPFGIKAMEELQKINDKPDTASDSMVMLLAMNTASVQLVPPVVLVAVMGLQINQLIFAIIAVTGISLGVAIAAARLLGKMKRYRQD